MKRIIVATSAATSMWGFAQNSAFSQELVDPSIVDPRHYTSGTAERHQRTESAVSFSATSDLRSWSIRREDIGKVEGPGDHTDCGMPEQFAKEFLLTRPGETNVVAVIVVRMNGVSILNPKGFEYGLIPALSELTMSQADELWGARQTEHPSGALNERTYKLATKGNKEFWIDLTFEGQRLQKYRMRSSELNSSSWCSVN